MKIGLQLYTVRDSYRTPEEFFEVLQKVKELGYEELELAGFGGVPVKELKEYLSKVGLRAISSHQSLEDLEFHLEEVIANLKELQCKYIVCAFAPTTSIEEMKHLITVLKNGKAVAEKEGLELIYHNHSHEFIPLEDGSVPMDYIMECCRLELDTYWVFHAGVEPCRYLKDHESSIALIHVKDGDFAGNPSALGEGINNVKGILAMAEQMGLTRFLVENDFPSPEGLGDISRSMKYLEDNK
jgi:sugar phosphate isomerase/epimerase